MKEFNQEELAIIYGLIKKEKARITPFVITDRISPEKRPEDLYKTLSGIIEKYKENQNEK